MSEVKEEPTPPAPFPEGKGEKDTQSPVASGKPEEAKQAVTPFPSGRGAGGVGSSLLRRFAPFVAILACGFAIWYFAIRTPEPRDDFGRFQGEWQLAVPAEDRAGKPGARLKPVTIRVTGDRWVYIVGDKDQKRYTMTLRPEANPKEIDLTQLAADDKPLIQKWPPPPRPVVLRGIYTIDRDRAKVVIAPGDEARPTDLDGTDGWLLERVK
jgi:uncharacterized protein (TIGR03067 family)